MENIVAQDPSELALHLIELAEVQGRVIDAGLGELEQMSDLLEDGAVEILDRLHRIGKRYGFEHLLNGADPYDDTAVDFSAIMREVLHADRARQAITHIARLFRKCSEIQHELAAAARALHPDVEGRPAVLATRVMEANLAAGMSDLRERMAAVIIPDMDAVEKPLTAG